MLTNNNNDVKLLLFYGGGDYSRLFFDYRVLNVCSLRSIPK